MLKQIEIGQLTAPGAPVILFKGHILSKRTGQQSIGQRPIGHHPDVVLTAVRKDFLLHAPVEHIPTILRDINPPRVHARFYLTQPEIGDSHRPNFSLLH